jgi:hypothetical protein
MSTTTATTYALDGQLLEVCDCGTLCPCWVGDDPDNGTCHSFLAYHIERGQIRGLDVSGLTLVLITFIPGNIFAGNIRAVMYLDAKGTQEQRDALFDVYSGKLGGAIADVMKLITEVQDVRVADIQYNLEDGRGTIRIGDVLYGEMEPYRGPDGQPTKLVDSAFSTIPGSPAYVAKASRNQVNLPEFDMVWEYTGRNAIQGVFHLEA